MKNIILFTLLVATNYACFCQIGKFKKLKDPIVANQISYDSLIWMGKRSKLFQDFIKECSKSYYSEILIDPFLGKKLDANVIFPFLDSTLTKLHSQHKKRLLKYPGSLGVGNLEELKIIDELNALDTSGINRLPDDRVRSLDNRLRNGSYMASFRIWSLTTLKDILVSKVDLTDSLFSAIILEDYDLLSSYIHTSKSVRDQALAYKTYAAFLQHYDLNAYACSNYMSSIDAYFSLMNLDWKDKKNVADIFVALSDLFDRFDLSSAKQRSVEYATRAFRMYDENKLDGHEAINTWVLKSTYQNTAPYLSDDERFKFIDTTIVKLNHIYTTRSGKMNALELYHTNELISRILYDHGFYTQSINFSLSALMYYLEEQVNGFSTGSISMLLELIAFSYGKLGDENLAFKYNDLDLTSSRLDNNLFAWAYGLINRANIYLLFGQDRTALADLNRVSQHKLINKYIFHPFRVQIQQDAREATLNVLNGINKKQWQLYSDSVDRDWFFKMNKYIDLSDVEISGWLFVLPKLIRTMDSLHVVYSTYQDSLLANRDSLLQMEKRYTDVLIQQKAQREEAYYNMQAKQSELATLYSTLERKNKLLLASNSELNISKKDVLKQKMRSDKARDLAESEKKAAEEATILLEISSASEERAKNIAYISGTIGFIAFSFVIFFIRKSRHKERELDAVRLETLKSQKQIADSEKKRIETELEKKRLVDILKPHFLLNALTYVSQNALKRNPIETANAIDELSLFLKDFQYYSKKELVTLEEEMKLEENYLEVAKLAYDVDFDYHPPDISNNETSQFQVPPFLFLSVFENSIKYGSTNLKVKRKISVEIKNIKNGVEISIYNNGTGLKEFYTEGNGISATRKTLCNFKTNGYNTAFELNNLIENDEIAGVINKFKIIKS